jgi:N-acetylmuramoyl-L-alanine amidase
MFERLLRGLLIGLLLAASGWAEAQAVKAVRLWPGPDYTRVTIELSEVPVYQHFLLDNPKRLVLDLEGVKPDAALSGIGAQVSADAPLLANIRAGLNRPGVTRLVFDLKAAIEPRVFALTPTGEYSHRLVLDMYPQAAAKNTPVIKSAPPPVTAFSYAPPEGFKRTVTVALDAGHGGEDPGARGAKGSYEKDITLSVARRVKAQLDRVEGMRAVLVRDGDYFIPLHKRVEKARNAQADLFVSIHADAFMKPDARGSSVFALSESGATSAAASWLAKKENDADLVGGVNVDHDNPDVKIILIDLSQTQTIRDSLRLARMVLEEIGSVNNLHKPYVEQAGFAVLKAPDIPSILVETAFISNPEEEKRLNDGDYQEKLAAAVVAGVRRYFAQNPPLAPRKLARSP